MDLPASVANKRLTAELNPLAATLTRNRGVGVPSGTPPSASVKIAVLSFHALTNCPLFSHAKQSLCFHALTNCPFSIPFVLTFMHRMAGVGGGGGLSSQRFSTHALSPLDRELGHRCGAIRALQNAADRACLAADVSHTEDPRRGRIPSFRRPRHESNLFAFHHQRRPRFRHGLAGDNQAHALPVHLPARTHPLHDFLARVAALGVTDMAVLQPGLVRDLLFAEVVAKPRNALRQPQTAQRRVAHRPAAVFPRSIQQNLPERRKFFALDYELRSGNSTRRTPDNPAGNCVNSAVRGRKFAERSDINAGNFTRHRSGLRPFQRQRAKALRLVRQRHIIHDDEFFQHFHQPFANHRVGHAKQFLRERIRFNLRENVSLRIQKQRNVSLSGGQALDVVRQHGVQVAHAVRSRERKVCAIILVDQRHALARLPEFRSRVPENIRQGTAEPHAHLRARTRVRRRQRRIQSRSCRSRFHRSYHPPFLSLSKRAAAHAMPPANPLTSDAIIPFMNDGFPTLNAATEGLIHITIPVGMLQCNCSIIGDPATREALVIDPGDEVNRILDLLGRHKLIVKVIVSTHAHIDHVGGLSKLHQYTGAPVLMHRDDLPLYQAMDMQAAFLGVLPPELTDVDQLLKEGDVLRWGSFEAQVIHTPGHTPGSVSLYLPHEAGKVTAADAAKKFTVKNEAGEEIEIGDLLKQSLSREAPEEDSNADDSAKNELPDEAASIVKPAPQLFSGDTLFAGSIGRTDLWGGSMHQIMQSLRTKLMHLPDDTVVYPGHGPVTTIGHERHLNPFLQPE